MAKRGSKSKAGERYPCGKLRPEILGPTPEHIEHRRALVGGDDRAQRYAAYPLGVLYARRLVLSGDHYAGQRYAALFVRATHPRSTPSVLGILVAGYASPSERDPKKAAEERSDYRAAHDALARCGTASVIAVEDLVLYDHGPALYTDAPAQTPRLKKICEGLHALHQHFELVDERSRAARA